MSDKDKINELRELCDKYGIDYAPQAGEKRLQELLDEYYKQAEVMDSAAPKAKETVEDEPKEKVQSVREKRNEIKKKALALVRFRCTCNDPMFKKWKGNFYQVENKAIGTVKKYIPFNNKPYHAPEVLVKFLESQVYQDFEEHTDRNGVKHRKPLMKPRFNIERMAPLTKKELEDLAKTQAARADIDD